MCTISYVYMHDINTLQSQQQIMHNAPSTTQGEPCAGQGGAVIQSSVPQAVQMKNVHLTVRNNDIYIQSQSDSELGTVNQVQMTEVLPSGWQACNDPSTSKTYYQNHVTHATQWEHPGITTVAGASFGLISNPFDLTGQMQQVAQLQTSVLGQPPASLPHNNVADLATDPNIVLTERDAEKKDKFFAALDIVTQLGGRLVFIVPAVLRSSEPGTQSILPALYFLDFVLLLYFGSKKRYCPGCLYNPIHVFRAGKKFEGKFVTKSRRFSATKKLIVGVTSIATLSNVVSSISDIMCIGSLSSFMALPWDDRIPTILEGIGIVMALPKTLVAVPACAFFLGYFLWAYLKFYLNLLFSVAMCQAKSKLQQQQQAQQAGKDQRHMFQRIGSLFSNSYSKDSVNAKKVAATQRQLEVLTAGANSKKQCCGIQIPDLGSNAGTWWFGMWALIWEKM
jgi:hypothetical protein